MTGDGVEILLSVVDTRLTSRGLSELTDGDREITRRTIIGDCGIRDCDLGRVVVVFSVVFFSVETCRM